MNSYSDSTEATSGTDGGLCPACIASRDLGEDGGTCTCPQPNATEQHGEDCDCGGFDRNGSHSAGEYVGYCAQQATVATDSDLQAKVAEILQAFWESDNPTPGRRDAAAARIGALYGERDYLRIENERLRGRMASIGEHLHRYGFLNEREFDEIGLLEPQMKTVDQQATLRRECSETDTLKGGVRQGVLWAEAFVNCDSLSDLERLKASAREFVTIMNGRLSQ